MESDKQSPVVDRTPDERYGCFAVECDDEWVAGTRTRVRLIYTVGLAGLPRGSRLKVAPPNTAWTRPLVPFARYWEEFEGGDHTHYVPFMRVNTVAEVRTAGPARVHLEADARMMGHGMPSEVGFWRWWISADVEGGDLAPGDAVVIHYGKPDYGERDTRLQRWAGDVCFVAFVRVAPEPTFHQVADSPFYITVRPGPPALLKVVVPSVVRPGRTFPVRLAVTDQFDCLPETPYGGAITVSEPTGDFAGPIHLDEHHSARVEVRAGAGKKIVRVTARDASGQEAISNPALRRTGGLNLFWGDLHAQSRFHVFTGDAPAGGTSRAGSLSSGEPHELYDYARNAGALDFLAITDQAAVCSPAWEEIQQAAADHYEPGRFVTFKAYEAGSPVGHRNVIYSDVEVEPPEDSDAFSLHPPDLYEHYRGRRDVMIIPHHVKIWTDWTYHDPALEPLLEVYSTWGSGERSGVDRYWDKGQTPGAGARAAWARGYRMGVIASSDTHVGMPGRSVRNGDRQWTCQNHPAGFAAVWCEERTRESIFEALRTRACYGTTGARMIVEFFVNGHMMGSEIRLESPDEWRHLTGAVVGTDRITEMAVVSNDHTVMRVRPKAAGRIELDWTDAAPLTAPAYYYLRATQADGQRAWTSPIWVDPPASGGADAS